MKEESDKLSEITVTDYEQPHFPDFDEDYDKALKECWIKIENQNKEIKKQGILLVLAYAILIPCLMGLLVNDTFSFDDMYRTEIKTTIGK